MLPHVSRPVVRAAAWAILRPVNTAGIPLALSYDDVLLAPRRSGIGSRSDVDVSTRLTRNLRLAIPVVSANMDTVTESEMAIAMARAGGIGIVHRFLSVEEQVAEVARVKRAEALVIADPHTIAPGRHPRGGPGGDAAPAA